MTRVQLAIMQGLKDLGEPYRLGAKPRLVRTPRRVPGRRDCSGEVRLMVAAAGVRRITRANGDVRTIGAWAGSVVQWEWCRDVPVRTALGRKGIGLLLFIKPRGNIPGHVALSLGNGYTLEARGSEGVCIVKPAENKRRGWDRAGKVPKLFEKIAA